MWVTAAAQVPALQSSPIHRGEFHIHRLVPLDLGLPLSYGVGTLPPDIVVGPRSLWPHELELEFALVVYAVFAERVQDAVVWVIGVFWVHAQPSARGTQVLVSLTEQQLPCQFCFRCRWIVGRLNDMHYNLGVRVNGVDSARAHTNAMAHAFLLLIERGIAD